MNPHKTHSVALLRPTVAPRITALVTSVFLFLAGAVVGLHPVGPAMAAVGPLSDTDLPNVKRPSNPEMIVLLEDGLSYVDDNNKRVQYEFTASGRFVVEDNENNILSQYRGGKIAKISYKNGKYILHRSKRGNIVSEKPLRITPLKMKKTVTALSYENRPAWNEEINDNYFFGSLELQYDEEDDALLLMNQLGIEKYVRGIAEAGNENDQAYLRALFTAARTYAYWHISNPTKHADEPYILTGTANDQVYRGASFSDRAPNVVAAQKATRRKVIKYNGDLIIAPYFSRSDGRTRSWGEVWGGDYEWAQSVEDPCCGEGELLGHGVGMSAAGARHFAEEEDWTWKQILKYYYTGVKIKKGY